MGGKLDALYYALREDNVFAIVDLPSHVHAASLGAAASASGLVETRTLSLLTVAEMDKALGEDTGRLRLTFRYRARSWTVVVEADGTLSEAPALGR